MKERVYRESMGEIYIPSCESRNDQRSTHSRFSTAIPCINNIFDLGPIKPCNHLSSWRYQDEVVPQKLRSLDIMSRSNTIIKRIWPQSEIRTFSMISGCGEISGDMGD